MNSAFRILTWLLGSLVITQSTAFAVESPSPWPGVLQTLERVEQQLQQSPLYGNPTDRAEATTYLAKTLAYHLNRDLIAADPENPRLIYNPGFGFPNADTYYIGNAHIDDQGVYRLYGRLGTVNQTIIGLYSPQAYEGSSGAGSRIRGRDLVLEDDGSFELFISKHKQGKNWIPMTPGTSMLSIYQIFGDWARENKGLLLFERLDTAGKRGTHPSPDRIARQIAEFNTGIEKMVSTWLRIAEHHISQAENKLSEPRIIPVASLGSFFTTGNWNLAEDQALVIEFDKPEAASYWGWTFYQAWGDLLDVTRRQSSLNFASAEKDEDGRYRLVLSSKDPGVANWIDIGGHPRGVMTWRATTDVKPQTPSTTVVPLGKLSGYLPKSTQRVTPKERKQTIRARQDHMRRRLAP